MLIDFKELSDNKRFFFTQISAPIIFFLSGFIAVLFLKLLHFDWNQVSTFHGLITALLIGFTCFFAMILWGRVLVVLGVLTKEEAKGYPYSKPWEKSRKDNNPYC